MWSDFQIHPDRDGYQVPSFVAARIGIVFHGQPGSYQESNCQSLDSRSRQRLGESCIWSRQHDTHELSEEEEERIRDLSELEQQNSVDWTGPIAGQSSVVWLYQRLWMNGGVEDYDVVVMWWLTMMEGQRTKTLVQHWMVPPDRLRKRYDIWSTDRYIPSSLWLLDSITLHYYEVNRIIILQVREFVERNR